MNFENIKIPVLALRGLNIFPEMTISLDVQRDISVNAVNTAMKNEQVIFITAQKDAEVEKPEYSDLYSLGVVAIIKQILKLPDNNLRVLVKGIRLAQLEYVDSYTPYITGSIVPVCLDGIKKKTKATEATVRSILSLFDEYFNYTRHINSEVHSIISSSGEDFERFTDLVAANLDISVEKRQDLLETLSVSKRLKMLLKILTEENEILALKNSINEQVKESIDKNQREYYLREQLKVIHEELNGDSFNENEIDEYLKKLDSIAVSDEVYRKISKEIKRLQLMPDNSHEATVVRTYLDTVFDLPWNDETPEMTNPEKCKKILDKEHYGLQKVKERILEYLAVRELAPDKNGMILCLIGPPGVGKTSVVSSVASAMGRKFARLSLGGVRDEADIRGHRKTYIGSMPGRIINAVKNAGSSNAVILLDEIDKMASDFRGDPASALLEVLDKEQNHSFRDHYLEIPFDLSKVMFITTANTASSIPPALYDRLEIIELSSYTYLEKFNIAKKHLLPKQLKEHNVKSSVIRVTDSAIKEIIEHYTLEAGVRNLERELASVIRKAVYEIRTTKVDKITVGIKEVERFLGVRKFDEKNENDLSEPGVVNGLAYTSYGGTLLNIEATVLEGSGKVELTGQLGDIMKESARAAICYIRSKATKLSVDNSFYKDKDIHIHVPEGATPKDGPSAGITMATALVSALSGKAVRQDVAMTGEITIRGRVLPIGGLKEKALAAHRHKIYNIIIPYDNLKDITNIPEEIKDDFNFIPVKNMDEVIKHALI
ncbi:MAG: endopeptidase La [Ruminococcaceae bacterium]|nr:endopeptidase La [Oscillospiraceae bacterium]